MLIVQVDHVSSRKLRSSLSSEMQSRGNCASVLGSAKSKKAFSAYFAVSAF